MTCKVNKIYWDSTAFICFLGRIEGERRKICEDILYHARDGKVNLYTSTFTVAEVIRPHVLDIARTRLLSAEEIAEIQEMFQWPWVKKIDLDQRVARQAVELERDYALSIADSIHAASAIVARVDVLQHWERKDEFGKISRLIAVEHPRMLTYGAVAQMPISTQPRPFRPAMATAGQQYLRLRSRP
jgi:predicted nucleic acid-binding protein